MLHTSLGGSPAHGLYAPCGLADLHGAGFDYWALGHIHQRFEERGRAAIVMPGNPQGRDINEGGAEVGDAGDNRRRSQDRHRAAVDERCAVRAGSRRSCRRRGMAGSAEADREGASRRARRGAERASGGAAHARRRNAARLAAALGRRHAGGRIAHGLARRSARPGSTRSSSTASRRERTRARRQAIPSPNCAR